MPSDEKERIISGTALPDEQTFEYSLRPKRLREFIGQQKVKDNLAIAIQAARGRGEVLDHVLLYGPPGLGKTTLANIIANELGVAFQGTSGPVVEDKKDLAAILSNVEKLLSVSGVGPKLAVTLLSGLEIADLVAAIRKADIARLVCIPGVGRKTAERLIVELRDKLATFAIEEAEREAAPAVQPGSVEDDVVSALVNLGYARAAAESALREARASNPNGDFENWLRGSLRLLARKFFS